MIENKNKNSKKNLRRVGNEPTTSRTTTGALHRCATTRHFPRGQKDEDYSPVVRPAE